MLATPLLAVDGGSLELGLLRLKLALALAQPDFQSVGTGEIGADTWEKAPRPRRVEGQAPPPRRALQPPEPADPAVLGLISLAIGGDVEAFGELYDRYVQLVYRYVFYRVGNGVLAEDFTSETFLRALRAINSYHYQGKDFGAWLITIARNLVADHFKSSRYRLELSAADLVETPSNVTAPSPEGLVLEALNNEELLAAVKKLAPDQQECVALRFLAGMSVTETALAMGKREGAVKALQYRAVRSLARLLPREQP